MSGIFKSVKKAFKKVGKLVKKIAPVLIIAAAVYFGGAYLMSMGAAGGTATAGSVAGSVTKSAGVWKSFLGGLANGNAGSSAVAYAEASYQAVGANLSLAAQVNAGTNAVQSLGITHNVAVAVENGIASGKAFESVIKAGGTSIEAAQAGQDFITNSATATTSQDFTAMTYGTPTDPNGVLPGDNNGWGVNPLERAVTHPPAKSAVVKTIPTTGGEAPQSLTDSSSVQSSTTPASKDGLSVAERLMMENLEQGRIDSQLNHDKQMEMLAKSHEKNMAGLYMQGAGMLMSAYGASQPTAEEKEQERRLNWKLPPGPGTNLINPSNPQTRGLLS